MVSALSCWRRVGRIFYCLCTEGSGGFGAFLNNPLYIIFFIFLIRKVIKPLKPSSSHHTNITAKCILEDTFSFLSFQSVQTFGHFQDLFCPFEWTFSLTYFVYSSKHFRFITPKWEIDFLF